MLVNIGDVVDGVLVSAIAVVGRRISVAVDGLRGRRRAADVTTARWFETYELTSEAPDLPALSLALTDQLTAILRGDEVQAALQELLAARLTDAPESDAAAARQVLILTLGSASTGLAVAAEALASYYDDQICALVARLEGGDPPLLAQIRSEAFSTRMINILNAIERHTAALSARPAHRTEAGFLTRYRRHVVDQHGKLEPPDFDRRRRVPMADIYVPTAITEDLSPERAAVSAPAQASSFTVYDLAGRLDRSVLLGDPGGGKTTAANVLMHHFALAADSRVPFLVTLRDYAATDPPERSVTGHIEHTLKTFYQCPAPPGLVDLLLLTGRAVVIFDGLDELLDTSRRADVTTRIERFCAEYPLAPMLVTSRLVGYDQARLDDGQFSCYRLGGFDDEKVVEYAHRWFAQDQQAGPDDAEAFLAESDSIPDLRSNPLLLSLMCILYRGAGSLPRDRSGVYEQCANLLFRRWDARRRIHQELRAGHLLEPALRHLAWWLYSRNSIQPVVSEGQLIGATIEFLYGRGFEAQGDARAAAREFVEFCRGRMWVFSDAGTTATGERLYSFTHRTFLEYFAAAQLAYASDSPEQLAHALISATSGDASLVVAELAVQIKDRTSNDGAPRIYGALLDGCTQASGTILGLLALCLRSVDPSPRHVRELTRLLFEEARDADQARYSGVDLTGLAQPHGVPTVTRDALLNLMLESGSHRDIVADEVDNAVADVIRAGDRGLIVHSLRLAFSLAFGLPIGREQGLPYWRSRVASTMAAHRDSVVACARTDAHIRFMAVRHGLITTRQALDMPGGPSALFQETQSCFARHPCHFIEVFRALYRGWPAFGKPGVISELEALGEYLAFSRQPPRLRLSKGALADITSDGFPAAPTALNEQARLGAAVGILLIAEGWPREAVHIRELGPLGTLAPYLIRRLGRGSDLKLPELPIPTGFQQMFRDWAEGRVDVIAPD